MPSKKATGFGNQNKQFNTPKIQVENSTYLQIEESSYLTVVFIAWGFIDSVEKLVDTVRKLNGKIQAGYVENP